MTEEKRDRVAAAITVNVILLIAILAAVVLYQVVVLTRLQARRRMIIEEIQYYQSMTEESEYSLEQLQSEENLKDYLIEFGWHY